jgi:hypothetical protein
LDNEFNKVRSLREALGQDKNTEKDVVAVAGAQQLLWTSG